jgi:hypothetical protein
VTTKKKRLRATLPTSLPADLETLVLLIALAKLSAEVALLKEEIGALCARTF